MGESKCELIDVYFNYYYLIDNISERERWFWYPKKTRE